MSGNAATDNQLRSIFESVTKNIDEDMNDFGPLQSLCRKYNIEPSHVVIATVAAVLLLTIFGIFQHIFVTLFGLLYPAYMSFKVLLPIYRLSTDHQKRSPSTGLPIGLYLDSSQLLTKSFMWCSSSFLAFISSNVYFTFGCFILAPMAPK